MATLTFTAYCQDPKTGAGVAGVRVRIYPVNNDRSRGAAYAETTSTAPKGRWTKTIDTASLPSPTGEYEVELLNPANGQTRVIYPDVAMQIASFVGANGVAPVPANSITTTHIAAGAVSTNQIANGAVTNAKIAELTIDNTIVPGTDIGPLTGLLGAIGNMIRSITGKPNWRTYPAITLETLNLHKSRHATGGADALSPADIGAATAGHKHGGGDITSQVALSSDAQQLRNVDGRSFPYFWKTRFDKTGAPTETGGPFKTQIGTNVVNTNSAGQATITLPLAFPTATLWVMACNGDFQSYRYPISVADSDKVSFKIKLTEDAAKTLRVNWMVVGY